MNQPSAIDSWLPSDVSAVVCTLNSIASIEACLTSLRGSRVGEIIVVDANSTDGTTAIALEHSDRVLTDPGTGLGNARNIGIAQTSKPLILNMGSDNVMPSGQLERMIRALEEGGYAGVSAQTRIEGTKYPARGLNAWRKGRFRPGPASVIGTPTLFRGDLLRAHPYDPERTFSDDSELCERWQQQFGATFAISDAEVMEIGKTSWQEVRIRARMYGISDHDVYRRGVQDGWSTARKIRSLAHPLVADFLTPLRHLDPGQALSSAPFLAGFTALRYRYWLEAARGQDVVNKLAGRFRDVRGRLFQFISSPRLPASVSLLVLVGLMGRMPDRAPLFDPRSVTGQIAIVVAISGLALARPRERILRTLVVAGTVTALGALTLSVLVLGSSKASFSSCVSILLEQSPTSKMQPCERSYDQPLSTSSTRGDLAIDFGNAEGLPETIGESNWDISALNSLRYNFRSDEEGPSRGRIPFSVQWTGIPESSGPFIVRYLGEGQVVSGDVFTNLPASYESVAEVEFAHSQGTEFRINFTWNPTDGGSGPFAVIELLDSDGNVVSSRTSPLLNTLVTLSSVLLALTLLALAVVIASALARARPVRSTGKAFWISTAVLLPILVVALNQAPGASRSIWELPIAPLSMMLFLMLIAVHFPPAPTRVLTWSLIAAVSLIYVSRSWAFPGDVVYRGAGDDFLTYEGFAREILETGSLQGGEDIFVYSPAIRYWLYLQHLVFGDSDRPIFALSLMLLMGAAWFAIRTLVVDRIREWPVKNSIWGDPAILLALATVMLFSSLIGYRVVWTGGAVLLSEYPTWPILIVALALTLRGRLDDRTLVLIGFLLGLALLFRINQGPGIAAIAITALVLASRHRFGRLQVPSLIRVAVPLAVPLLALAVWPLVHNLAHGGRWVPFQTSLPLPQNFPLPPQRLLQLNSDPTVAPTLLDQIGGVVVLNDQISALSPLSLIARVVQLVGVTLLILAMLHRFRGSWVNVLWLGIPVAFLLPHVFIQVYVYYPRHVVAGYLTATVVFLALAGRYLIDENVVLRDKRVASEKPCS